MLISIFQKPGVTSLNVLFRPQPYKETTGCSLNLSPGSAPLHFFFGWLVMNLGSNYLSHRCSSCPQPTDNQLTVVED